MPRFKILHLTVILFVFITCIKYPTSLHNDAEGSLVNSEVLFDDEISRNLENDTVKIIIDTLTDLTHRQINGNSVEIEFTGNFNKAISSPGQEYPLEIKEVYPGVMLFDKYFTRKIKYENELDSITITSRVVDRIEFLNNGIIKSFDLDRNNPYLKSPTAIKVFNHYSDAEGATLLPTTMKEDDIKPDVFHLRQAINQSGSYTTINYWKNEVSNHWITKSLSTIVILDTLGNTICTKQFSGFVSSPAVSSDGLYFMVSKLPLETVNNSGIKNQKEGFQIWQTDPLKLIYEEANTDTNMWITPPSFSDSIYLRVEFTYPNSADLSRHIVLFNTKSKMLFKRTFTTSEWKMITVKWFSEIGSYDQLIKTYEFLTYEI